MADLFDTRQVRDDPHHWDALAGRIAVHAALQSNRGSFAWLAHSHAGWIGASLLLAAALVVLVLPGERSVLRTIRAEWAQGLAPTDEIGRAMIWRDGPPALDVLLLGGPGGGGGFR